MRPVFLLGLFASAAVAAPPASDTASPAPRWDAFADTVFQHYTEDQGLPVSLVTALAQDGEGFIWAGTQGGLARFDGYRFRNFAPDPKDPGALPDSYVATLHTDAAGHLWVGTVAGGLARYAGGRFVVYSPSHGGLHGEGVRAIADDGAGGIWVATEGGLDHLDAGGRLLPRAAAATSAEPASIQAVLRDKSGALWIGAHMGLFRQDAASGGFVPVALPVAAGHAASVTALFEDGDGRLWIGTAQDGAFVKDTGSATPHVVRESGQTGDALARAEVRVIAAAGPHEVWLGTYGAGIVAVNTQTFTTHRLRHDPTLVGSLMHDNIWALLQERSGSMWVGDANGLEHLTDGAGAVLTLFGVHGRPGGLADPDVSAVFALRDGRLWLGYGGGAVDLFDPGAGTVAHLAPDPDRPDTALPTGYVHSFADTAGDMYAGDMYIGTNRGLYRVGPAGRGLKRIAVPGRELTARVDSLLFDNGVLWIGGRDSGLFALPLAKGSAPTLRHLMAPALSDSRVNALVRGRGSDLWIGTFGGLDRLDLATGAVERIQADPSRPGALGTANVGALAMDRDGRLWAGTIGGGIQVLVSQDSAGAPLFRRISVAEGLPNADIGALVEDPSGQMWASTDDGLAVIDEKTFAVRALRRADGAVIRSYWVGAGTATPEGEIVFGGLGGLSVVRPGRLVPWTYRPPVVVTGIRVGGRESSFDPASGNAARLTVPAAENNFSVEFAALDYSAPERNRYAYRLEGFDRDWVEADPTKRLAAYTNLAPGNYVLRLRGSNRDGVWTERTLDLPLSVEPAWYQTLAFRLLVLFTALGLVSAFIQFRTGYLRRRQLDLERQVRARTAEVLKEKSSVQRLEHAERLQRALYVIADLTNSGLERSEMLRRIHEIVGELMYAKNFFIVLYDAARRTLRFVYFADVKDTEVYDPATEIREQDLGGSLTVPLIHRGEPLMGSTVEIRARLGIGRIEGRGPEAEAWLGVPMLASGVVRGAIVVQSYDPAIRYTESDQALLGYVAEHILTALLRHQAKEELEQQVAARTRELAQANQDLTAQIREREAGERLQTALFRIAELSSTGGHLSEFLKAVHAEIGKLIYAHNFYVALLVEDGRTFEFPYAVDERDSSALFQPRPLRHGLTEYVLRSGRPLLASSDTVETLMQAGEVQRIGTPSVCWLGVPLVLGERIAGVLVVQSYTPGVVYTALDQELLTFVSRHIATALMRRQAQESLKAAYTELQGRMEELRRTQSELIENEKMASLGRLVAGVAHEINTPLGIGVTAASHLNEVFGAIDAQLASAPDPELAAELKDARRCVELVLSNLGRADHLVRSFKQVAVDQSSEERRRVLVQDYLDDVLASLGPRLKRTPHKVEIDCPAGLEIDTYPGALYQIVANMVVNALMHAFDDQHPGHLRIAAHRLDGNFELIFADDGKGMSNAVRAKVFEPFFTTRRGSGGTGLGLHLVYNLVTQLLHGTLDCKSAPGEGTVFTIRLPLAAARPDTTSIKGSGP
ncbi:MAG: two-component regulator propeller domain-containing protein [Bacillota bacterium]